MKIDIKFHARSATHDHQIELTPGARPGMEGRVCFVLDGEAGEADCVEIAPGVYSILLGGRSHEVLLAARLGEPGTHTTAYDVTTGTRHYHIELLDPRRRRQPGSDGLRAGPQEIRAPMPGRIVRILVAQGQVVAQDQGLLVIEAMKMQNELRAPRSGRVEKIYIPEGAGVETGFKLLRLA